MVRRLPERLRSLAVGVAVAALAACERGAPSRLEVRALPAEPAATASSSGGRYQLRNVGGRPLLLDGLVPACGCRVLGSLPGRLASGASTVVGLACRRPQAGVDAARELRIRSSDPASPESVVPLAVPPRALAGPEPSALYLGYVAVGESVTQDVVLPAPVAVESLPPPSDGSLALEPMPARADGRPGVRVRFTPRNAAVVRAELRLGPDAIVPVTGVGHRAVAAFPAEIALPEPPRDGVLPPVTLMLLADAPLRATAIDYPPGIAGELREVVPGRQFRLRLRARDLTALPRGAAIRLRGDTANEPLLTIPIVRSSDGARRPGS